MDGKHEVITVVSKYLCFKEAWISQFCAGIIKITIMLIKTTLKDPTIVKRT